jgi:metalloendopeptidase OMA1, mitochondrial
MTRISFLRSWRLVFGLAVGAIFFGCTTGPRLIPTSYLNEMAAAQFTQMKSEMALSTDRRYNAQAQRVGERIAAIVRDRLPDAQWEFVVFDDPAINAFAMPGGKIGVNTGLLELVESDDELAAVMGHEVCHVLFEHGNQRMSAELIRQGVAALGMVAADHYEMDQRTTAIMMSAYGIATELGGMLPFSRNHEIEADREGLLIAARAGYDPRAAVTFWQKMEARSEGQPPEWLSTHPSHGNRIGRLEELMPQALALYEQFRR